MFYPGWFSLMWIVVTAITLWGVTTHDPHPLPEKGPLNNFWQYIYILDVSCGGALILFYLIHVTLESVMLLCSCYGDRRVHLSGDDELKRYMCLWLFCGIMFILNIIASYVGKQWYTLLYCLCWYVACLVVYHPKGSYCGTLVPPVQYQSFSVTVEQLSGTVVEEDNTERDEKEPTPSAVCG
jgi:hypothetical protein